MYELLTRPSLLAEYCAASLLLQYGFIELALGMRQFPLLFMIQPL